MRQLQLENNFLLAFISNYFLQMKFQNCLNNNKYKPFRVFENKIFLFLVLLFFSNSIFAQQELSRHRSRKLKHRISAGPVISFYKNNTLHTVNTKAKAGFNAAYKCEIPLARKTNLLVGMEYMSQGLKFNGYFSAPNHTYLFDQTFSYSHDIQYQEVQLPLAFKIALNPEKEKVWSSYIFVGTGFRYLVKSTAFIESDSTQETVMDGPTNLTFENHIVEKHFNAFLQAGFGFQKNFSKTGHALFFEFTYKYNISRLHYVGYNNSNNLNIKDNNLAICIGIRF